MESEITEEQILTYYSGLKIDKKVALLPKRLRASFCQDVLNEIFEPYWRKMKNYQNKEPRLTDEQITAGKERIMTGKYLFYKSYRNAIKKAIGLEASVAD